MRALIQRPVLVVLFGLLLSTATAAQHHPTSTSQRARPLLGPQAGLATHDFDFFIGGQFSYPVANQIDVYPSLDIYFPGNNVSAWGLDAEVRYWPKLSKANAGLYVGGGLDYTHASAGGASSSDAGLGLLGGWDFKTVSWRPFAQLRIVIGDADRIEFGGGVNFKL